MSIRITVVKAEEYWSRLALAWASGFMGFILTIGFLLVWIVVFTVVSVAGAEWIADALLAPLLLVSHFAIPGWYWWRRGIQVAEWKRSLLAGASFGFGVALFPWSVLMMATLADIEPLRFRGWTMLVTLIGAMPPYVAAFFGVGIILRERYGRVVVQDGTLCPGCGYSLIGNESMICPECGRGFTFEELETTEEEFRRQHQREC